MRMNYGDSKVTQKVTQLLRQDDLPLAVIIKLSSPVVQQVYDLMTLESEGGFSLVQIVTQQLVRFAYTVID